MEAQKEKFGLQEYIDLYMDNYELAAQLKEDLAQKFSENGLDFTAHSHNIEEVLLLDSEMNITINLDRFDQIQDAYHPSHGALKSFVQWDMIGQTKHVIAMTVFEFCHTYPCWNFENIHEFEAVIYG